jgi:hypothetical protein
MGYFLWLNERIDTINAANVPANINASNTVTGTTGPQDVVHLIRPFLTRNGSEPTTF